MASIGKIFLYFVVEKGHFHFMWRLWALSCTKQPLHMNLAASSLSRDLLYAVAIDILLKVNRFAFKKHKGLLERLLFNIFVFSFSSLLPTFLLIKLSENRPEPMLTDRQSRGHTKKRLRSMLCSRDVSEIVGDRGASCISRCRGQKRDIAKSWAWAEIGCFPKGRFPESVKKDAASCKSSIAWIPSTPVSKIELGHKVRLQTVLEMVCAWYMPYWRDW